MSDDRPPVPQLVEGKHFYREGPYFVFTELYLRERGYCCESGCRHCPYGFRRNVRVDSPVDAPSDDSTT